MAAERSFIDLADYFQKQANRARNADRKEHYQRCADEYRAKAQQAEQARNTSTSTDETSRHR